MFTSLVLESNKRRWGDTQWSRAHTAHQHPFLGAKNLLQLQFLGDLIPSSGYHGHWNTHKIDLHRQTDTHRETKI